MRAVLAGVLAALIVACGGSDVLTDLEVCNQNLSWVLAAVSNDQGKPLDGLSHRTVLVETGTRVVLDSIHVSHLRFGATYPVISDRKKNASLVRMETSCDSLPGTRTGWRSRRS